MISISLIILLLNLLAYQYFLVEGELSGPQDGVRFQSWISGSSDNSSYSYFKSGTVYDSLVSYQHNSFSNGSSTLTLHVCMCRLVRNLQ